MAERDLVFLEGSKELMGKLNTMSAETKGTALLHLVEAGGEIVEWEAIERVPVDEGDLQASIHSRSGLTRPDRAWAKVGPSKDIFYAAFVEFGTRKMTARPYLRPALHASRDTVLAAMRDRLLAVFRMLGSGTR